MVRSAETNLVLAIEEQVLVLSKTELARPAPQAFRALADYRCVTFQSDNRRNEYVGVKAFACSLIDLETPRSYWYSARAPEHLRDAAVRRA
jgi:hypothetical protein